MKKLFILLTLISASAHAERWFEMPNEAGGKIILTEAKCSGQDLGRVVVATSPSGTNVNGCWYYFADMVHVVWSNGQTSSYAPNDFTPKEKK